MGDEYTHKRTVLEGVIWTQRIPLHQPIECKNNCNMGAVCSPFLVGSATTKTGGSNLANVERELEHLTGKYVRVTIEWREPEQAESELIR